jgi:hypothetical protein
MKTLLTVLLFIILYSEISIAQSTTRMLISGYESTCPRDIS